MRRRAALAALLIVACPAMAGVVTPDFPLTASGIQTGSATLAVGEPLLVVLPAADRPGYAWEARPADPSVLEPQGAKCAGGRGDTPVNARLPACFAWAGRASGTTVLTFVYRRHWETQPDGVLRYDLTVSVTR